jgi:hypothetical protein
LTTSINDTKTCNACGQIKPLAEFPKNKKGKFGRGQKCLSCSAKVASEFRQNNYALVYARKYKTTPEKVEEVLAVGVCEICNQTAPAHKRHAIDHCHTTGKIRGLLCDNCNKALGLFQDSPTLLNNAIQYLNKNA